ncbi:MAG TPA: hypothetical protein VGH02_06915 [Rhizomicrobium sp.]|jgi:hypothetical protein
MTKKPAEIMSTMVDLLSPLPSEERQRIIQATLVLLGETPITTKKTAESSSENEGEDLSWPPKAKAWSKQNGLTPDLIDQVFHGKDGAFEVIVEPPGRSQREKTINAYILTGIAKLLGTGETTFDDKSARELCVTAGCYSGTNHATYLKDRGNDFTGNREAGWTLTSPGLKHAAELIKGFAT